MLFHNLKFFDARKFSKYFFPFINSWNIFDIYHVIYISLYYFLCLKNSYKTIKETEIKEKENNKNKLLKLLKVLNH